VSAAPRLTIGELSHELRSLRLRLIRYEQRHRDGWSADLEAYDRRLVEAARMLAVDRPEPAPTVPLTAEDRAALEQGLSEAGLEVRTEPM
jgi:hypothetical protein